VERAVTDAIAETGAGSAKDIGRVMKAALGKLGQGTYGQCEDCGHPIAPARLEAKPAARYCIDCAAKH
jgi:DnaK suppressor protein